MVTLRFLLLYFKLVSHAKRLSAAIGSLFGFSVDVAFRVGRQRTIPNRREKWVLPSHSGKRIYFVFRGVHFIDFFVPIHQALDRLYPGRYQVLYVDYAQTLKRIRGEREYERFRAELKRRLSAFDISVSRHFCGKEVQAMSGFPQPDMIVTTEAIRHESFRCEQRVYFPHSCVEKEETIESNIRFNHFFQPSKPPYTYSRLFEPGGKTFRIHHTGYPKIHLANKIAKRRFSDDKPVVLFAPSLKIDLLLRYVERGILSLFAKMVHCNFIVKLHPSLASIRHYILDLFFFKTKGRANIRIDTGSSLQEIGGNTSLMVADFGSAGPEYRLSFGRRVIYLQLPDSFVSASDLVFRDHFGDAVASVERLGEAIDSTLASGDVDAEEYRAMKSAVLYNPDSGDVAAAKAIHTILGGRRQ